MIQRYRIYNCADIAEDKGGYCLSEDVALLEQSASDLCLMVASLASELQLAIREVNKNRNANIRCDQETPPDLWDEESIYLAGKLLSNTKGANE